MHGKALAKTHGVKLAVAIEIQAGQDAVADIWLVVAKLVSVPQGHVYAFFFLAFVVGAHGFKVALIINQQAKPFGAKFKIYG